MFRVEQLIGQLRAEVCAIAIRQFHADMKSETPANAQCKRSYIRKKRSGSSSESFGGRFCFASHRCIFFSQPASIRLRRIAIRLRQHALEHLRISLISTKIKPLQMTTDAIRTDRPTTDSKLFAHTRWDAVPAAAGLFHLGYFLGLFFVYPHAPLWVMLILGFVYSLMVNANINGIGHNFIHNPFFRSKSLNRLFGVTQSIACCFSQTYYNAVHMQHHKGNADRPNDSGDTI